jgi:uncharacterized membrane protein
MTRLQDLRHWAVRHPVVHGHPLHAALSDLPAALIPCAFVSSLAADLTRRRDADSAAVWAVSAALGGSMAAGGSGWWDWLTMPREHAAHRPATIHGVINSTNLALVGAATLRRRERTALLGAATLGVVVAGWIGGELVYHHGWRVRGAEEIELVEPKLKERGAGDLLDAAREEIADFERRETYLPPRR